MGLKERLFEPATRNFRPAGPCRRRGRSMDRKLKNLILGLLNSNRVMAIATNRPDGWPQTTIVGYVNDGFLLYAFIARNSQKYGNIQRDPRVSIAIGRDQQDPLQIKALSLAAMACEVIDQNELNYVAEIRLKRYPEFAALKPPRIEGSPLSRIARRPPTRDVVLLRLTPELFSVLDYSRGFGHSDLVTFSGNDLNIHIHTAQHLWNGQQETE